MGTKAAVNRLGEESSAKKKTGTLAVAEVPVNDGGPSRTRTLDPRIKLRVLRATYSAGFAPDGGSPL